MLHRSGQLHAISCLAILVLAVVSPGAATQENDDNANPANSTQSTPTTAAGHDAPLADVQPTEDAAAPADDPALITATQDQNQATTAQSNSNDVASAAETTDTAVGPQNPTPVGTESASPTALETADALVIDMRGNLDQAEAQPLAPESQLVTEYQAAIREAELTGGAYYPGITEHLLGLGTTLQQLNRHQEAIDVLKRGVHLARINSGLYAAEQLALLRSEIRSHMALGNFDTVDERQRYLYRVERRSLSRSAESAQALISQADWQRQAYLLDVGEEDTQTGRLMIMWDLYRMALNESIDVDGEQAIELKAPLMGMLKTQYLFAGYRGYQHYDASDSSEARVLAMNSESYRRGESVIKAILEVNLLNRLGEEQKIRDTVALGDWAWWFGKYNQAEVHYADAMSQIEALEKDQEPQLLAAIFGEPTPLPVLEGIQPLPPHATDDAGTLVVAFDITETGRVNSVERLREPEVEDDRAIRRLLRTLRDTRFRPAFVNGEPIETEGMVWSYEPEAWLGFVKAPEEAMPSSPADENGATPEE